LQQAADAPTSKDAKYAPEVKTKHKLALSSKKAELPATAASRAACLPRGRAVATSRDTVDRGENPDASTPWK